MPSPIDTAERRALLDDLLQRTSRTFALAIPLLPEPLHNEVGLGYLLFRIADTLEDAERLNRDRRIEQLGRWIELLKAPSVEQAQELAAHWSENPPSDNDDYNDLMRHTRDVVAALLEREPASQAILAKHVIRSAEGMAATLKRADEQGGFRLGTIDQLREYCYHVAGIVGEMLTELFRLRLPESEAAAALDNDSRAFGEALQLVNILKDAPDDAHDGRVYLPSDAPREDIIELARTDLRASVRYAKNLRAAGAAPGVVAFAELPRRLAEETLDTLGSTTDRKVSRETVARVLADTLASAGIEEAAP